MAENMLQQIADELREKWDIDDFAVAHRVGRVDIGEISLVVALSISPQTAGF